MFSRVVLISRGLDGFSPMQFSGIGRCPLWVYNRIELFIKGDDGGGDTPLPIPNREVKPARADGTAGSPRGRVGRRPFFNLLQRC